MLDIIVNILDLAVFNFLIVLLIIVFIGAIFYIIMKILRGF
ncbi:MAG: hypothetical protein ACKKMW_02750 [Candidatus Nealsonbacteria bacterium]